MKGINSQVGTGKRGVLDIDHVEPVRMLPMPEDTRKYEGAEDRRRKSQVAATRREQRQNVSESGKSETRAHGRTC